MTTLKILRVAFFFGFLAAIVFAAEPPVNAQDPLAKADERPGSYRPLGDLASQKDYFNGDEKVGERVFYRNGRVAKETLFKNGQRDGISRQFYENGKLFCKLPYKNDVLDGTICFYKENGDLLGESKFEAGTGVLRQFPLDSLVQDDEEIPYKNGVIDGTVRQWLHTEKGIRCNLEQYVHGDLEGWAVLFDETGVPIESVYQHDSDLHGVYRHFGAPEKDWPKFFINGQHVTEAAYRQAAAKDEILAKSLNDDGREWGKKAYAAPR